MKKQDELYSGKAKTLYKTEDPDYLIMHFRDDISAFDGTKTDQLAKKGAINNQFNAFIMEQLQKAGIDTHFVKTLSDNESLVYNLDMIPVECVVRNVAAGSLCRRLGVTEGQDCQPPLFEFFLKNDELHDPMINEYHIRTFGWAEQDEVAEMQRLTFAINEVLQPLFADAGMILVDYKLEFGRHKGRLYLGDEFTPDGCRLWDIETRDKLDKDRFRRGMGEVMEAYAEAANRLGITV